MGKEEQYFLKHMTDLANQAYMTNRPVVSSFFSLYEQSLFLSMQQQPNFHENIPISFQWWGGYEMAERKRLLFSPSITQEAFQIAIIEIQTKHPKYAIPVSHRDYLGAILNLGLKRETIGDILVEEQCAYVFCQKDMASFLCENLCFVKKNAVSCHILSHLEKEIEPTFIEENGSVSSLRLDCVVAFAFHLSRKEAQDFISKELVFINSQLISNYSTIIKEGQTISVRGKGKFILSRILSTTKKGKQRIQINRFH